jgi:DNA-directed RNA polymerase subunit RPC12/RpoP
MAAKKKFVIKKKSASGKPQAKPASVDEEKGPPQLITRKISPPPPRIVSTREALEEKPDSTFKFYCIRCGQKLQVQTTWVGKEVNCSTCGNRITVPEPLEE